MAEGIAVHPGALHLFQIRALQPQEPHGAPVEGGGDPGVSRCWPNPTEIAGQPNIKDVLLKGGEHIIARLLAHEPHACASERLLLRRAR